MTEDGLDRLEAMALDGGQNLTPAIPALIAALRADRAELARLREIEDAAAALDIVLHDGSDSLTVYASKRHLHTVLEGRA